MSVVQFNNDWGLEPFNSTGLFKVSERMLKPGTTGLRILIKFSEVTLKRGWTSHPQKSPQDGSPQSPDQPSIEAFALGHPRGISFPLAENNSNDPKTCVSICLSEQLS